ncbi:MAG: LLM class F420-dependent oxidoreductase, partial [Microbacterium sp.]
TEGEVARRAEAVGRTLGDVRAGATVVGGADEIAERVDGLRALGIDRVHFQLMDLRDTAHVDYLGAEVLPLLRR